MFTFFAPFERELNFQENPPHLNTGPTLPWKS